MSIYWCPSCDDDYCDNCDHGKSCSVCDVEVCDRCADDFDDEGRCEDCVEKAQYEAEEADAKREAKNERARERRAAKKAGKP